MKRTAVDAQALGRRRPGRRCEPSISKHHLSSPRPWPGQLVAEIGVLEAELADRFEQHPHAMILRSLPGLG